MLCLMKLPYFCENVKFIFFSLFIYRDHNETNTQSVSGHMFRRFCVCGSNFEPNSKHVNIDPVNIGLALYGFICLLIFKHIQLKEGGAKSSVKSIKFLCYMPPGGHKTELTVIYI